MIVNETRYSLSDQDFPLGIVHLVHGAHTELHSHDFIEFVYVVKGCSMHRIENEVSLILPGDLFFILPGVRHEYWKTVDNEVYNCIFYPQLLGDDLPALARLPLLDGILTQSLQHGSRRIHCTPEQSLAVASQLSEMEEEACRRGPGWQTMLKSQLTGFLVRIARLWAAAGESGEDGGGDAGGTLHVSSGDFAPLIERASHSRRGIEETARSLGYSPDYFTRCFKKLTGLTPSAYLTKVRVARAAEELLIPGRSVAEAAERAGFEDANYFSRLFKKETGKTPSQFRGGRPAVKKKAENLV